MSSSPVFSPLDRVNAHVLGSGAIFYCPAKQQKAACCDFLPSNCDFLPSNFFHSKPQPAQPAVPGGKMTRGWKRWQSNTKVLLPKLPTLQAKPQVSAAFQCVQGQGAVEVMVTVQFYTQLLKIYCGFNLIQMSFKPFPQEVIF